MHGDSTFETVKTLQEERAALVKRASEITGLMPTMSKNDPERAKLVGEKATIDARLKQLNPALAEAQRRANGSSSATKRFARGFSDVPTQLLTEQGLSKKDIAAVVAMHAMILKFADSEKSPGKVEDRAEDIAEAAWEVASAMYPDTSWSEEAEEEERP